MITQDAELYGRFLAAKEQIGICGSVLDENVAQMLRKRESFLGSLLPEMERRIDIVQECVDRDPA
jgi:hypothetical protein